MHGAQGPGGMNPRTSGRGVYARRRLLAVLVVLLLLALLMPRACQALMGSGNDAGPNGEQQAGAAGTDTGEGNDTGHGNDAGDGGPSDGAEDGTGEDDAAKQEGFDESKDEPSSRGVPFRDDAQENGSGDEEVAPDLLALVTPQAADEETPAGEDQNAGGSAPSPSGPGGEPQAEEQPISELQFALAASPEQQPSPEGGRAPTRRSGPAEPAPVAEHAASSRGERIRARVDRRLAATPVTEPAALHERGAGQIVVEPAVVEPAVVEPAAAETFAPAPPVAVAAAPSDTALAPAPVGALNGAPAVPAALPAGPRLAGPGPSGTPGPSGLPGPSAF